MKTDAVTHTRQALGRLGRRMAGKMDKTTIIASAVVGSLGLLSAILGFSAEVTKITATDVLVGARGECLYPQNPAAELGVCAAVFLLLVQITVSAVGGCCGCCMSGRSIPSETKRIIGVVCAVMSWLVTTDITAEGKGATMPDCYVVKRGIFAGAAVLALAATAFGITSYVMLRTQADEAPAKKPPLAGVAMGQPQFLPPQASHV
ncbi:hypothetical protein DAI22_05g172900 [Oryza sativa Japonica Group]|nr:hypothetical protein DAI22_05g172900 [Oryza sativa Japonica Group]